jgi:hypothetical protein
MGFDIDAYKGTLERLKGLTPEEQQFALGRMYPVGDSEGKSFQDLLNYARAENTPDALRAKLKVQNEFDQERIRAAAPYKLLFGIPEQIAQGFGNQAAMTVLGARSAVDAMNETMRARTPLSFASAPYQIQKYLS